MRVNSVAPTTFQAQIPKNLRENLFWDAHKKGHQSTSALLEKMKAFENWGLETSSLASIEKRGEKPLLCLVNSYLAPFQKVIFDCKNSLLESFMAISEQDVIQAEYKMKI